MRPNLSYYSTDALTSEIRKRSEYPMGKVERAKLDIRNGLRVMSQNLDGQIDLDYVTTHFTYDDGRSQNVRICIKEYPEK